MHNFSMDASLKQLRILQIAMLVAIVLYVVIGEVVPHSVHPMNPVLFHALALLAASTVFVLFFLRRMTVRRASAPRRRPREPAQMTLPPS